MMNLCSPSEIKRLMDKYSLEAKKCFGQNFLINPSVPEKIAQAARDSLSVYNNNMAVPSASSANVNTSSVNTNAYPVNANASSVNANVSSVDANASSVNAYASSVNAYAYPVNANAYPVNANASSVLEIGPGVGSMTNELCKIFDNVVSVEIDRGLIPLLNEVMADYSNFLLINDDFMKLELPEFFKEHFPCGNVAICANLPYYITTPIIMKLIESWPSSVKSPVSSITIMIQNEVANRLAASPSSKDYGAISAALKLWGNTKKLFTVAPGCFYPAPKVSSAVVQIIPHKNGIRDIFPSAAEVNDPEKFISNVKENISAAFGMRRKTLVNAMASKYSKENLENALIKMGYPTNIRGEKLSAEDFCRLTLILN